MPSRHWPRQLIIVRHGQSAGNVARDAADLAEADRIPRSERDADVPLSDLGRQQAAALGHWFASEKEGARPETLLSSPYRRVCQTTELFRASRGCRPDEPICFDERLRKKEFGILDGLTVTGIHHLEPPQAEFRRVLGKFYHRPPGGESWCDARCECRRAGLSDPLLNEAWLRARPLPPVDEASDKLQMATVWSAAVPLGVLVPEAAMVALPAQDDGEIAARAAELLIERAPHCDALILGPGMSVSAQTDELVTAVLAGVEGPLTIVLDAAALTAARNLRTIIARHRGKVILTPHHGEMAILSGLLAEAVAADPRGVAQDMAHRFQAVVLFKGKESIIAGPADHALLYEGGCVGLATGGSGDVLAGIVGGLAARGAPPFAAAAWATWVHGRAGCRLERATGGVGFLAQELLPLIPLLLNDPNGKGE